MTLRELVRVTGYPWYGAGGHQTVGRLPLSIVDKDIVNADGKWVSTIRSIPFGMRLFQDTWTIVPEKTSINQNFTIKLNPTEQNFHNEDFFQLLHANNRRVIFCPSGCFDWFVPNMGGKSQRKSACYDHTMNPLDPLAWADFAHLFKLLAEYFKDKNYKVVLQFGNELDFRWNVMKELVPEEIAVGQWECIKAVLSVNPDQEMMLGCTLNPKMETHRRIKNKMKELAAAEGKTLPKRIIVSDNHYVRDSGGNQGGGLADTPESQWTQTYEYRKELNAWLLEDDLEWTFEITEFGYSNSTSTSFAALKQKAPVLEGVSHDEAPGVLWFRSLLMYASFSQCRGISWYHCKDGYEAEPFTYIGINYDKDFGGKTDWSSKPVQDYMVEQMNLYGDIDGLVRYQKVDNIYYATLPNGTILHWSNKVNVGNVTPKPTVTNSIPTTPTTMWHPKKSGNSIVRSDNGVKFTIYEGNSPETILAKPFTDFKAIIDYWKSVGINTVYATLYAGDKYSSTLHPYNGSKSVGGKNFGDPASGWNEGTIANWREKLLYATEQGFLLHLLLSEKENHFVHTDEQQYAFIDKMVASFGDLPVIWDREEFPVGNDGFILKHFPYLQSKDANNLVAIHNNTGEKPWLNHADVIDFISIQADISSFDGIIRTEVAKGFLAYSSEMTGGFTTSDISKAQRIKEAGGTLSCGAGIYIPSIDQDATLAQIKSYESVYKALTNSTTTNPPPTMRKAYLTLGKTATYDAADELQPNENVPVGTYGLYVDGEGPVDIEVLKDGVPFIAKRTERGKPLNAGGDTNGVLFQKQYTAGNYKVIFNTDEINFTVGTVTPPPPPPVSSDVTKIQLTSDNKLVFTAADGRTKTIS